jgi:hypothetical protein
VIDDAVGARLWRYGAERWKNRAPPGVRIRHAAVLVLLVEAARADVVAPMA